MPSNEAERLEAVRALDILGTAPEEHFDAVCRNAQVMFGLPVALVSLVDEERQWFKARCGFDADGTPRGAAFCTYTILSDEVLVIEDALQDVRVCESPLVTGRHGIRFYAGAPLIVRPGIRLGSLCVLDTKPRTFSPEQRQQLRDLARMVVAHLRLHEMTLASVSAHDALQAATTRLRLAQEAAGAGLFDWDLRDDHAHLSPETLRHLGLPEDRSPFITGQEWAATIHPGDLVELRREARRAIATGSTYRAEFRVPLPEGGERWVLGLGRVASDARGRAARISGISLDCTEQRQRRSVRLRLRHRRGLGLGLLVPDARLRAGGASGRPAHLGAPPASGGQGASPPANREPSARRGARVQDRVPPPVQGRRVAMGAGARQGRGP